MLPLLAVPSFLEEPLVQALLGPLGLLVFVLLVLETGRRGVWVWGRERDAAAKIAEDWKAEAHAEREANRALFMGRHMG